MAKIPRKIKIELILFHWGLKAVNNDHFSLMKGIMTIILKLNPKNYRAMGLIGDYYRRKQAYRQANKYYKDSFKIDPKSPPEFYNAFKINREFALNQKGIFIPNLDEETVRQYALEEKEHKIMDFTKINEEISIPKVDDVNYSQPPKLSPNSSFQKLRRLFFTPKFWVKFKQKQTRTVDLLQRKYNEFYKTKIEPWDDYPSYLQKKQAINLQDQLEKWQKSIPNHKIWFRKPVKVLQSSIKQSKERIKSYNERYLKRGAEKYFNFFSGVESDAKIELNKEQIRAILINERFNLLVAGPGSGKTRVITERAAFFHLKKGIPQEKILLLAFNTSAAAEIRTRLLNSYGMGDVDVRTFHSLGMRLISTCRKDQGEELRVESNSKRKIGQLIKGYLESSPQYRLDYMSFFNHYLIKVNFAEYHATNQSLLEHKQTLKYHALDGTLVKSIGEREIANFFIQYNIAYEYEPLVSWCDPDRDPSHATNPRQYHPDFYLPDYDVYLEHWAIAEDGVTPVWFQDDPHHYHSMRVWKREQFQKHGKILWETDYQDWLQGRLKPKLKIFCQQHAIELISASMDSLLENIGKSTDDRGLLADQIASYIDAAKNCGYSANEFQTKVFDSILALNAFDASFFSLVVPIFLQYDQELTSRHQIDFNDMINLAINDLELENLSQSSLLQPFRYDLVFVDEFQDISPQRFRLLTSICNINPRSRIFCVGDDWQAIYGFAGATNSYLTHHSDHFDPLELNFLQQNYRNTPSILEFGERIIQQTGDFIKKEFKPFNSDLSNSIQITRIQANNEEDFNHFQIEEAMALLIDLVENLHIPAEEIMVLSRFNFGYSRLKKALEQTTALPIQLVKKGVVVKKGIRFYSTHKSKGLEADVVIILNLNQGQFGFPSEIDSGINYQFINESISSRADEEARLFFVALTRARKRVQLFCWENNESSFIPPKVSRLQIYQTYLQQNYWMAQIRDETERALLLNAQGLFQECMDVWVPKSFILSTYSSDQKNFQKFQIQRSFIDTKIRVMEKTNSSSILGFNHPGIKKHTIIQSQEQNSRSKTSKKKPSVRKTSSFNPPLISSCIEHGYLQGFIMTSTPKAYLMRVPESIGKFQSIWIPKSVILHPVSSNRKKYQHVAIKKWWLRKRLNDR
ncbi:UvrD-helicase domain-containing protein [Candidatus Lokiarchaeum ossiferum]|uniref:UvrD-helicase domain-containing protein n=1 Tax=Candidatus Lokiarchaeum ossiferum TaxID=2951803 RepID=UPI00352F767F